MSGPPLYCRPAVPRDRQREQNLAAYLARAEAGRELFAAGPAAAEPRAGGWTVVCGHCGRGANARVVPAGWRTLELCGEAFVECDRCAAAWDAEHGGATLAFGRPAPRCRLWPGRRPRGKRGAA